jgi:hypothetical protein
MLVYSSQQCCHLDAGHKIILVITTGFGSDVEVPDLEVTGSRTLHRDGLRLDKKV